MRIGRMIRTVTFSAAAVLSIALNPVLSGGQVNVTTWHNDNGRTGQNTNETTLTTGNVNKYNFGLLCKITLPSAPQQEQIYGQPLVVANSNGANVYVATMQDNIYVFDVPATWNSATSCGQIQGNYQKVSMLRGSLAGQYPADACFIGNGFSGSDCSSRAICPSVGVLGTPVIDTSSNTMYVVTESQDANTGQQGVNCNKTPPSNWYHYLHALDLTSSTLAEKFNGPVQIQARQIGYAIFSSQQMLQRPGLLLTYEVPVPVYPTVYAAFSMMDGTSPNPSGWVLGYDAQNLNATLSPFPLVFATVQNPDAVGRLGGGIWQSGGGLAAGGDQNGGNYVYFSSGDGVFDANNPGSPNTEYGDSFVKLTTELQPSDYFAPADAFYRWDYTCTNPHGGHDLDFGSGGVMVVPPDSNMNSAYQHVAVKADKENYLWVIDRTNPGQSNACTPGDCGCMNGESSKLIQKVSFATSKHAHSTPAFWDNGTTPWLYIAPQDGPLMQYLLNCTPASGGPICASPASTIATLGNAATPSVSSSGGSNGIVWAIDGDGSASGGSPAILYAFRADNLVHLYDSTQCPNRDTIGSATKFSVPTIANGYVYVGTQTDFDIFGPTAATCD